MNILQQLEEMARYYAPIIESKGGSGLIDPDAGKKLLTEFQELEYATDGIDKLLELADICYYAGKLMANGAITNTMYAELWLLSEANDLGISVSYLPLLVQTKYDSRIAVGKNHAAERAVMENLLKYSNLKEGKV